MKKIAMLGDLHGNLTATLAMEKALKDYHVASAASASLRITISGINWAKSA